MPPEVPPLYWLTEICNSRYRLITYGLDWDSMPVFAPGYKHHRQTKMRFPSMLKFMPYAMVGKWRQATKAEIEDEWGIQVGWREELPDSYYEQMPRALAVTR